LLEPTPVVEKRLSSEKPASLTSYVKSTRPASDITHDVPKIAMGVYEKKPKDDMIFREATIE